MQPCQDKEGDVKHKILIVDDEEDILELLKVYLELNEYEVITAKNGSEAIKQSEKIRTLFYWTSICRTWTASRFVVTLETTSVVLSFF